MKLNLFSYHISHIYSIILNEGIQFIFIITPTENVQIFLNFTEEGIPGYPHSIAIDQDKNLWITCGQNGKQV